MPPEPHSASRAKHESDEGEKGQRISQSGRRWNPDTDYKGAFMRQEDFNEMMRLPGEVVRKANRDLQRCPECGEAYCGDGKSMCVDCSAAYVQANREDEKREAWREEMKRDAFG